MGVCHKGCVTGPYVFYWAAAGLIPSDAFHSKASVPPPHAVGHPIRAARRNAERTTIRWNGAIAKI